MKSGGEVDFGATGLGLGEGIGRGGMILLLLLLLPKATPPGLILGERFTCSRAMILSSTG